MNAVHGLILSASVADIGPNLTTVLVRMMITLATVSSVLAAIWTRQNGYQLHPNGGTSAVDKMMAQSASNHRAVVQRLDDHGRRLDRIEQGAEAPKR